MTDITAKVKDNARVIDTKEFLSYLFPSRDTAHSMYHLEERIDHPKDVTMERAIKYLKKFGLTKDSDYNIRSVGFNSFNGFNGVQYIFIDRNNFLLRTEICGETWNDTKGKIDQKLSEIYNGVFNILKEKEEIIKSIRLKLQDKGYKKNQTPIVHKQYHNMMTFSTISQEPIRVTKQSILFHKSQTLNLPSKSINTRSVLLIVLQMKKHIAL